MMNERDVSQYDTYQKQELIPQPSWVDQYVAELGQLDWPLSEPSPNSPLAMHSAYYDAKAPKQLEQWQQSQVPVELSIVTVMPNKDVLRLPVGALAYAATALDTISQLRTRYINVDQLRIMSPCYINQYCDGGDLQKQLQNAGAYKDLITGYKEAYYPELTGVSITLDTGKEIDDRSASALREAINQLQQDQPDLLATLVSKLSGRAEQHKKGAVSRQIGEDMLSIAYLLAHPEAWGYGDDEILFAKNGTQRINYMPASELSYLVYMMQVGRIWSKADNEIITVISNKQITPPYHGRKGEPSLGKLLERDGNAKMYDELITDAVSVRGDQQSRETVYALRKISYDTNKRGSGQESTLSGLLRTATIQSQKTL